MLPPCKAVALVSSVLLFLPCCGLSQASRPAGSQGGSQLPCTAPPDLSTFMNCRVNELAALQVSQNDPAKKSQTPSSSSTASSLVDRSSVSDIAGIALDVAGLSSATSQPNTSSATGSLSAYALRNWLAREDSLDPSIYAKGLNWRRYSLLLGRDLPDSSKTSGSSASSGSSSSATQSTQQGLSNRYATTASSATSTTTNSQRGVIVGGKVVLWARRDASNSHNAAYFDKIGTALASQVVPFARATLAVQAYLDSKYGAGSTLPANWSSTWSKLTTADKSDIDKFLSVPATTGTDYYKTVDDAIKHILNAPQLSVTYQADIKLDSSATLHRTALILDKSAFGQSGKILTTANVGFDYTEKTSTTAAKKQFRASGDIETPLWSMGKNDNAIKVSEMGAQQITLELSGQGQWGTASPTYQAQVKVTIPVVHGVSIPFSCSYANQTQLVKETNIFGHVGLTLDLSKLLTKSR
jgi:hypothetical protein